MQYLVVCMTFGLYHSIQSSRSPTLSTKTLHFHLEWFNITFPSSQMWWQSYWDSSAHMPSIEWTFFQDISRHSYTTTKTTLGWLDRGPGEATQVWAGVPHPETRAPHSGTWPSQARKRVGNDSSFHKTWQVNKRTSSSEKARQTPPFTLFSSPWQHRLI